MHQYIDLVYVWYELNAALSEFCSLAAALLLALTAGAQAATRKASHNA
jgi:hypothetical protein